MNLKKIFAKFLLIILLFFGLTLNVGAISVDSSKKGTIDSNSFYVTDKGSLKITNVSDGDILSVYKILDVFYNSTSNIVTYEFTSEFKNFLSNSSNYKDFIVDDYYDLTSGDMESGSVQTTSTLDKLASEYAVYIRSNDVSGNNLTTSNGGASATLEAGSYLVLPVSTNSVYAVMVGNLNYTANGSNWILNDATIVAKASSVKIDKFVGTIADGTKFLGDYLSFTANDSFSVNFNEEYSSMIRATVLVYPTNATNKKYEIVDTLDSGINFSGIDTVKLVYGDDVLGPNDSGEILYDGKIIATVSEVNKSISIVLNLDNYSSNYLVLSYNVTLNNSAVLAGSGNSILSKLTYSNDPYGDKENSITSSAVVYTYGLSLYNKTSDDKGLEGAIFYVYSDNELKNKVGEIVTDSSGYGKLTGIKKGTYYVKQISAASGYNISSNVVDVSVDSTSSTYTEFEVVNKKSGLLPSTGGSGNTIYILIGFVVIVSVVVVMYFYYKKKK